MTYLAEYLWGWLLGAAFVPALALWLPRYVRAVSARSRAGR